MRHSRGALAILTVLTLCRCGAQASLDRGAASTEPPPDTLLDAEAAIRIARGTEVAQAFLERYGACDRRSDLPLALRQSGAECVDVEVSERPSADDGRRSFQVSLSVPAVTLPRPGLEGPEAIGVTVEVDGRTGEVLSFSPALEVVAHPGHCSVDDDCLGLSGSGVPFLGCANDFHALLHFAGAFEDERCRCLEGRCQAVDPATATRPSDLIARQDALIGRQVVVEGVAVHCQPVECTQQSCGPEDPCCNDCGASLALADVDARQTACFRDRRPAAQSTAILVEGQCTGDECGLSCAPLELGVRYRLTGSLEAGTSGRDALGQIPELRLIPTSVQELSR